MIRSALSFAALLVLCSAAWAGTAREAREFADAKRRADIEFSLQQKECDKLDPELKDACHARVKDRHEETVDAARLLYLGDDTSAADRKVTAEYEEEMARCARMNGKERSSCSLDVQLRFRQ